MTRPMGKGVISRIEKDHIIIRSTQGGEIKGPLIPGFRRGDKIAYNVNGAKTHITTFFHRGTLYNEIIKTVKQKLLKPEPVKEVYTHVDIDLPNEWFFCDFTDYGIII